LTTKIRHYGWLREKSVENRSVSSREEIEKKKGYRGVVANLFVERIRKAKRKVFLTYGN
jgi:hypothetical protein